MNRDLDRARIPLLITAVLVLFGGVLGAITYEEDADSVTAAGESSTSTVPSGSAEGGTPATTPGETTTTRDPNAPEAIENPDATPEDLGETTTTVSDPLASTTSTTTTTTTAPGATTTTPPAATGNPGPSMLPAGGAYTYTRTDDDGSGPETYDQTDTVRFLGGDRTTGRFEIDQNVKGERQVSTTDGSANGFFVEKTVIVSSFGASDDCVWNPPFQILGALAPGATWTFSSECDTTISGFDVHIEISGNGTVTGTEVVDVLGEQREVWVTDTRVKTVVVAQVGTNTVNQTNDTTSTSRFDPKLGAEVSSTSVTVATGDQEGTTNSSRALKSFAPAS